MMVAELVKLESLRMPWPPVFDIVMMPVAVLLRVPPELLMPKPPEFDIVMVPELSMVPLLVMVPVEVMIMVPVALFVRV